MVEHHGSNGSNNKHPRFSIVYVVACSGLVALTLFSLCLIWLGEPSGLPAHAYCWKSSPGLILLHLTGGLLTWSAYSGIPIFLIYLLVRGRVDGSTPMMFPWLVVWAVLFIWACSQTHLMDELEIFWQIQWQRGWVKLVTGVISWAFFTQLICYRQKLLTVARAVYRAVEEEEGGK